MASASKRAKTSASAPSVAPIATVNTNEATTEEDEWRVIPIERLQDAGINAVDITKLVNEGITTVGLPQSLRHRKNLMPMVPGSLNLVMSSSKSFLNYQLKAMRQRVLNISTGSRALDNILGGGVETGSLTEFFGEFRTGKTQLMHTICVTSQLDKNVGGGHGSVIYLDLEGNFRPSRVEAICERYEVSSEEVLDNILVERVYTHEEQINCIGKIAAVCMQQRVVMVIIDSILALFRVEFTGRGELADRQQKLGKHLSDLVRLSEEFNLAVVYVNQVYSDPGAMTFFPTVKPIGGHVLAHASTTRVMLKKGRENERVAKIFDSPCLPENDCVFKITDGGIQDQ